MASVSVLSAGAAGTTVLKHNVDSFLSYAPQFGRFLALAISPESWRLPIRGRGASRGINVG